MIIIKCNHWFENTFAMGFVACRSPPEHRFHAHLLACIFAHDLSLRLLYSIKWKFDDLFMPKVTIVCMSLYVLAHVVQLRWIFDILSEGEPQPFGERKEFPFCVFRISVNALWSFYAHTHAHAHGASYTTQHRSDRPKQPLKKWHETSLPNDFHSLYARHDEHTQKKIGHDLRATNSFCPDFPIRTTPFCFMGNASWCASSSCANS